MPFSVQSTKVNTSGTCTLFKSQTSGLRGTVSLQCTNTFDSKTKTNLAIYSFLDVTFFWKFNKKITKFLVNFDDMRTLFS